MHKSLCLLRECGAILLDHTKGLVDIFLNARVRVTCSDDTLESDCQSFRPSPKSHHECLLYLGHAQHPDGQIQTSSDYKSCPIVQPCQMKSGGDGTKLTVDSRNCRMIVNSSLI